MRRVAFIALLVVSGCESTPKIEPPATHDRPVTASTVATSTVATSTVAAGVHFLLRHTTGTDQAAELPMIVAIHGLGDTPEGFEPILRAFGDPARLVFPRGLDAHGTGFAWFGRGPSRTAQIAHAATQLAGMLDELVKRYPTRGKPIVTGFSQGGMLAYALATLHPDRLAVAIPLAGALPLELVPEHAPVTAPPIFALHGDADPVLSIAPTRELTQLLRERGFRADLTEYPDVAHTVSPAMHRALLRHLHDAAR